MCDDVGHLVMEIATAGLAAGTVIAVHAAVRGDESRRRARGD